MEPSTTNFIYESLPQNDMQTDENDHLRNDYVLLETNQNRIAGNNNNGNCIFLNNNLINMDNNLFSNQDLQNQNDQKEPNFYSISDNFDKNNITNSLLLENLPYIKNEVDKQNKKIFTTINIETNNNFNIEKKEEFPIILTNEKPKKNDSICLGKDEIEKKSTNNITFYLVKSGRSKKEEGMINGRHNHVSLDNAYKKVINSCNKEYHNFIKNKLQKGQTFPIPTIKTLLEKENYEEYYKLTKKNYYEMVKNSIPKRYKGQKIKGEKKELTEDEKKEIFNSNQINLNRIIQNSEIYIYSLFMMSFGDILRIYLYNVKNIYINNEKISTSGFKTLDQCFNEGEKIYTEQQKNEYKQAIIKNVLNFGN